MREREIKMVGFTAIEANLGNKESSALKEFATKTFLQPYLDTIRDIGSDVIVYSYKDIDLNNWAKKVSKLTNLNIILPIIEYPKDGRIRVSVKDDKFTIEGFLLENSEIDFILNLLKKVLKTTTETIPKIDVTLYGFTQNIFKTTKSELIGKEAFLNLDFRNDEKYSDLLNYYYYLHEVETNSELLDRMIDLWGLFDVNPKDLAEEQLIEINEFFNDMDWEEVDCLSDALETIITQLQSDPNYPKDTVIYIQEWEEFKLS